MSNERYEAIVKLYNKALQSGDRQTAKMYLGLLKK